MDSIRRCLLVSAALHLLVEKPALALRDRLLPGGQ